MKFNQVQRRNHSLISDYDCCFFIDLFIYFIIIIVGLSGRTSHGNICCICGMWNRRLKSFGYDCTRQCLGNRTRTSLICAAARRITKSGRSATIAWKQFFRCSISSAFIKKRVECMGRGGGRTSLSRPKQKKIVGKVGQRLGINKRRKSIEDDVARCIDELH